MNAKSAAAGDDKEGVGETSGETAGSRFLRERATVLAHVEADPAEEFENSSFVAGDDPAVSGTDAAAACS
jgi:hypothetical protein